jgi:uracil-DNA glycosylase
MIHTWKSFFETIRQKAYFQQLEQTLEGFDKQHMIYPKKSDRFRAFELTEYVSIHVVILGQDPYHQEGQANGLAFSVSSGVPLPPSLKNIYREIELEGLGTMNWYNGDLTHWAQQGVFLLNTYLTVEQNKPLSHKGIGYEMFIHDVITTLNQRESPMVFLLWGEKAKQYQHVIASHHVVLTANHPSPLSANRGGWFGCQHFSRVNTYMKQWNRPLIQWQNDILK